MAASMHAAGQTSPDPDHAVSSSGQETGSARLAEGVVGRLFGPSGHPIAGARIVAQSLDEPAGPIPEIAILSDVSGHFVWPLRPGRYRLNVVVAGQEIAAAEIAVLRGKVTTVDLRAQP